MHLEDGGELGQEEHEGPEQRGREDEPAGASAEGGQPVAGPG